MEQAERELPKYLRSVRPLDARLLALIELDDLAVLHGCGRRIGANEEAQLDREVARVCREIIQARLTREHHCGAPLGRRHRYPASTINVK
jgi:hypothetical protein